MTTPGASRRSGRPYAPAMSLPAMTPAPGTTACVFCGTTNGKLTCEHVIPKWARRSFDIKGPVTVNARKEGLSQRRRVSAMQALNITLDDAICDDCNSVWLSRLERRQAAAGPDGRQRPAHGAQPGQPAADRDVGGQDRAPAGAGVPPDLPGQSAGRRLRGQPAGAGLAAGQQRAAFPLAGVAGLLGLPADDPGEVRAVERAVAASANHRLKGTHGAAHLATVAGVLAARKHVMGALVPPRLRSVGQRTTEFRDVSESPPRVRGARGRRQVGRDRAERITPAYAGNTEVRQLVQARDRITSACAGNPGPADFALIVVGGYPRARGESSQGHRIGAGPADHPRAYGENVLYRVQLQPFNGSPPRARGAPVDSKMPVVRARSPPVRGQQQYPAPFTSVGIRSPPAYGEHAMFSVCRPGMNESPPHVQRAWLRHAYRWELAGITPACAGSTTGWPRTRPSAADHPRACGDHCSSVTGTS
jgi:hypothetical protein